MEKTQLKEKVQKHVDSLFLTLSQNLDVQVSEDVQNRFTNRLSQEAFDVLLAQKKQGLIDATEQMFTEMQNDLGMTFREQTKSDLLEILLTEAGVSFEDNPTEIKPKDVSSVKPEIHSEEKSEAEANAPQVADETVQEADKVAIHKNSGKPWTEECHDPEIIRKVNEVFAQYYAKDFDKEQYSRDMYIWNIFDPNSSRKEFLCTALESFFGIKLDASIYLRWKRLGDIYDSVLYCLKEKEDIQELEAETKVSQVADETVQEAELKEDKPEVQEKLPQVAEANAPQVADETVQEADKVVTNKNSGKPWTEECHDPEIINNVNGVIARYYEKGEDDDREEYSRDRSAWNIYGLNRQSRDLFRKEIEELFDIKFGKSIYSFWKTFGDIYDSVLYCLKQKSDVQQTSGRIDKQEVYGVKKIWGDYKVDPSDSSPKVRKIVDTVNQALVDKLGIDKMQITRESRLKDDLGADSLDIVEFIMEFEKAFNFSIPDDVAEQIQTVGDAYDCLYYRMKE